MLMSLAVISIVIMGVYTCFSINQINKDIKYIRLSIDELENTIHRRQWVIHDRYKQVQ